MPTKTWGAVLGWTGGYWIGFGLAICEDEHRRRGAACQALFVCKDDLCD